MGSSSSAMHSSRQLGELGGKSANAGKVERQPEASASTTTDAHNVSKKNDRGTKHTNHINMMTSEENKTSENGKASSAKITIDSEILAAIEKFALNRQDSQSAISIFKEHPSMRDSFVYAVACIKNMHNHSEVLDSSYHLRLNNLYFENSIKDRAFLVDFLGSLNYCEKSFEVYKSILRSGGLEVFSDHLLEDVKPLNKDKVQCLFSIRGTWWNFSDSSLNFGSKLAATGILQELVQDIENLIGAEQEKLKGSFTFLSAVGALHNVAKVPNLRQTFRDLKVVEILANFLKYEELPRILMVVLLLLALIIDENQTHLLLSHGSVFDFILALCKRAWKTDDHVYEAFSLEELVQGLAGLSKNDEVKKMLGKKGILALNLEILQGGKEKEKEGAAKLLWELSFDQENKTKIQENEALMKVVRELSKNPNKNIAKASQGVLWVLGIGNEKSKQKSGINAVYEESASGGHLMISYNWSDQKKLIEIRDALLRHNYNVWMDIDNLSGSTLQGMAEAVEKADAVLVCMSEKYKESLNCRSEAEYAFSLQKPIIPLLMQHAYKPDGWMGILLGTKLFFNFSGKYPFEDKLKDLVKEISDRGKLKDGNRFDNPDGLIEKQSAAVASKPPPKSVPATSELNVVDWIAENNLAAFPCLRKLKSEHLLFLKKLSSRAPEFYFSFVMDLLNGKATSESLTSLMQVTDAVERIRK